MKGTPHIREGWAATGTPTEAPKPAVMPPGVVSPFLPIQGQVSKPGTQRMAAADYAQAVIDAMSEADFQTLIVSHAKTNGWLVHHARKARTKEGWRTAIQGDAGFPDLVLTHAERRSLLVLEVKSTKGRVGLHQDKWVAALQKCGVHVRIVRPADWVPLKGYLEGEG